MFLPLLVGPDSHRDAGATTLGASCGDGAGSFEPGEERAAWEREIGEQFEHVLILKNKKEEIWNLFYLAGTSQKILVGWF